MTMLPSGDVRARTGSRAESLWHALATNFLGHTPRWYKQTVLTFLLVNPVLLLTLGAFAAGWALLAEFVFCLAMALRCYPLQPGGLLAIESLTLGLTSTA